jgi:hypothetical protein
MPAKLNRRVARETAAGIYARAKLRPVIIELEAGGALLRLRLKGQRRTYALTYGELYRHAVRIHIAADKLAKTKARQGQAREA